MAITANRMKDNLRQARRSARVEITPQAKNHIRECLVQGMSKKALITLYGISYQDLKELR
ncbi:hypothetical protein [Vibrio splendidus]|uniref:hypothetical protein n=1 Tax=Vibrio splendidus TaxID=29497 RepID=UPI000D38AC6A|nr:hypothetical protein [Vibrio splendidus]PTP95475.1 hypothetical protein CWO02_01130 [Vibrio splendidus]